MTTKAQRGSLAFLVALVVIAAALASWVGLSVMGGRDKGTDLSSVVAAASRAAHAVVCYGEGGGRIADAFEESGGTAEILRAEHLADALDVACGVARPGDTVLLSPACASFDECSGFEERGRVFKRLVAERIAAKGARA